MEITLKQFAEEYNEVLSRRGFRMSEGYIYRLIREDRAGVREDKKSSEPPRALWFNYKFEGNKDSVRIII